MYKEQLDCIMEDISNASNFFIGEGNALDIGRPGKSIHYAIKHKPIWYMVEYLPEYWDSNDPSTIYESFIAIVNLNEVTERYFSIILVDEDKDKYLTALEDHLGRCIR